MLLEFDGIHGMTLQCDYLPESVMWDCSCAVAQAQADPEIVAEWLIAIEGHQLGPGKLIHSDIVVI